MANADGKTQFVRWIDVAVLGPFLIYAGLNQQTWYFRVGLIVAGYATLVYNARNFARIDPSNALMMTIGSLPLMEIEEQ